MKCLRPWKMYWNGDFTPAGSRDLKAYRRSDTDYEVLVPCGTCVNCRLNKSSFWAVRCMCEAKLHEHNYFLTFTVDDDHLEDKYGCIGNDNLYGAPSVHMDDISQFNKNLRNYYKRHRGEDGIRFVACSEYGSSSFRPHYHGIYFNLDIPDLEYHTHNEYGDPLYTSELINSIWDKGFVVIGELTFESAQYVAKYILKSVTLPDNYYDYFNIERESLRMSRRPGIGMEWFRKNKEKVMHDNGVYIDGELKPIPQYWIKQVDYDDPASWWNDVNEFNKDLRARSVKKIRKELTDKTLDEEIDEVRRRPFTEDIQKRNGV